MMILGALLLVDGPIPQMRIHLLTAVAVSIPFGLLTIFLVNIAMRARRNKVVTGQRGLIGEVGVAQTRFAPRGKVFVHGEIWDGLCPSGAEPGQTLRVTAIHDLTLTVEPAGVGAPVGSSLN
jgi:membrane-bound serine protease (ClpP class)